jgi:3-hydroxybutyryl-CoA dehydrogenase
MPLPDSQTICVCGAGTMGSGIAQVCAGAGYQVVLYDIQADRLQKGQQDIAQNLQMLVRKGKLTLDDQATIQQRLLFTTDLAFCRADVVIEAVAEKMDIKTALFQQLHEQNGAATLFASNTSSLSITELQRHLPHPQRVAGLHFFNPAMAMKLVEVVQGAQTDEPTIRTLFALAQTLGKVPVLCTDSPGFIVNRVARPYYLEAMRIVNAGIATLEQVDTIMEATGFKLGPFKLMDLIGLDINYAASQAVYEALGGPERLQPSPLQKEKVDAGHLGKKTGKGFYEY